MRRNHAVRRGLAAAALLGGMVVVGGRAEAGPTPTVTVTPNVDLVDFQPVQITGSGFTPNALLEWFECRGGAVDEFDCDANNADFIDVDGSGNVDETVYVDARIYLPDGTEVDCRTDPAGCEIGVGFLLDADEWPEDALHFDPAAPLLPVVTGSVTPDTGLVEGQEVAVQGEHLSFREESFARVCAEGSGDIGTRCDLDHEVRGVPDASGVATGSMAVYPRFSPPLGGSFDCTDPGTDCYVDITWGYDPPPDRRAAVPISFAVEAPPTTSTTTTTPATTTPTQPAAPAQPVAATPVLTG